MGQIVCPQAHPAPDGSNFGFPFNAKTLPCKIYGRVDVSTVAVWDHLERLIFLHA
jgi:hypothetical protein